jgi:hypothetical protein
MTVRERLGLGLAHAGPRITFTTLADILILFLVGMVLGETAGVVKVRLWIEGDVLLMEPCWLTDDHGLDLTR